MAFTRFNYDDARTMKLLQESTGPGRYALNTPGQGADLPFYEDPHIRLQGWGANLMGVHNGHAIDIASDLDGRSRRNEKYNDKTFYPTAGRANVYKNTYATMKAYTDETRSSHPSWMYRDLEQKRWETPFEDPQAPIQKEARNMNSSRVLVKAAYEKSERAHAKK